MPRLLPDNKFYEVERGIKTDVSSLIYIGKFDGGYVVVSKLSPAKPMVFVELFQASNVARAWLAVIHTVNRFLRRHPQFTGADLVGRHSMHMVAHRLPVVELTAHYSCVPAAILTPKYSHVTNNEASRAR